MASINTPPGEKVMQSATGVTRKLNLAADMMQAFGLAAAAGIGTALASGLVVVMIVLHAG
jgi:hypothetical protein